MIGNQAYAFAAPLENPANDALAMEQALQPLGFEVRLLRDLGAEEMRSAIEAWVSELGPRSVALFFYAGHGVQIDGENYLIPVDFKEKTESDAKKVAINADWVRQRIESSPAILRLLILDACRTNPFPARGGTNSLAGMPTAEGTFIALSTGPGTIASDGGDRRNGLFTGFLIAGLKGQGLELMDLFSQVNTQVRAATDKRQIPWIHSNVVGKFYFQPPAGWVDPRFDRQVVPAKPGLGKIERSQPTPRQIELREQYLALGKQHLAENKLSAALADLQTAAEADRENVEVLSLLATVQARLGLWDAAIASAGKGLLLAPQSAELYRLRGHALCEAARFREAIEDLSRAIDIAPDPNTYWLRSAARLRIGDLAGAEADRQAQRSMLNKAGAKPPRSRN